MFCNPEQEQLCIPPYFPLFFLPTPADRSAQLILPIGQSNMLQNTNQVAVICGASVTHEILMLVCLKKDEKKIAVMSP